MLSFLLCSCTAETSDAGAVFLQKAVNREVDEEITPEVRALFDTYAKEIWWVYLPEMDGYESFFENDFSQPVFYVVQRYFETKEKLNKDEMQEAIQSIFAAKQEYKPMVHQGYRKMAVYENGYYSPWIEGRRDKNREFYLLTGLNVQRAADNPDTLYVTVDVKGYYFEDTSIYMPGEKEKWLAKKADELNCEPLEAASKLTASGEISELSSESEWEATLVVDVRANPVTYKFLKIDRK